MPSLEEQLYNLLLTLGAGCILGLGLDIYLALIDFLKFRQLLVAVCDLLFWLAAAGFFFVVLIAGSDGEFRLHSILALGAGGLLYRGIFDRILYTLTGKFLQIVLRGLRSTLRAATWICGVPGRIQRGIKRELFRHRRRIRRWLAFLHRKR